MTRLEHTTPMIKLLYAALFVVFSFGSFGQAVLLDYQPPKENTEDACAEDACKGSDEGKLSQHKGSLSDIPSAIITPAPKVKQLRASLNPLSKFVTALPAQFSFEQSVLPVFNTCCKQPEHLTGISGQIIRFARNDLPPALA